MITGMDYRNGHHAMALGALNVFHLHIRAVAGQRARLLLTFVKH